MTSQLRGSSASKDVLSLLPVEGLGSRLLSPRGWRAPSLLPGGTIDVEAAGGFVSKALLLSGWQLLVMKEEKTQLIGNES